MNTPIPIQLAKAALHAGMIVPVITLRHLDGVPEFGMVDHDKLTACLGGMLCQLCGARLQGVAMLLARPMDFGHGYVAEPAQHPWRAAYSLKACPMLADRLPKHRDRTQSRRQCGTPGCWCETTTPTPDMIIRADRPANPWYSVRIPLSDYRIEESARRGPRGISLRHMKHPKIRLASRGQPDAADLARIMFLDLPY